MAKVGRYNQGKWYPTNPQKYVGDINSIVWRSSWELKVLQYFDRHPDILKYSSEEVVIPYVSPVDNRMHRYFVDFAVMYRTTEGKIEKAIIEVKPEKQTQPPKPGRNGPRYLEESMTYAINMAKWNAAEDWASKNGFKFHIWTERHLNI